MYSYIKGIIANIMPTYITLDNHDIGFKIYTPNPFSFKLGKEYTIYLYQHVREDEISLYGFKTSEEKDLFLRLIDVKGLGPKMALPMLATGSVSGIIDAIDRENILYLKKFPKIGDKVAKQIILDLKGKLSVGEHNVVTEDQSELMEVLKGLGYKQSDIVKVIAKVDPKLEFEQQIKEALKLFLK